MVSRTTNIILPLFLLPFLLHSTQATSTYQQSISFPAKPLNARSLVAYQGSYLSRRQTSSPCANEDEVCVGAGEDDSCWCVPRNTVEDLCGSGHSFCAVGAGACCPNGSTCGSDDGQAVCMAVMSTTSRPTTATTSASSTTTTETSSTSTPTPTEGDDEEPIRTKESPKPKEKSIMNPGIIIGIVFSILGVIGLSTVIYILCAQKRKEGREIAEAYEHPDRPAYANIKKHTLKAGGLAAILGRKKSKKDSDIEKGRPEISAPVMIQTDDRNFSFQQGNSTSEAALVAGVLPPAGSQGRCITPPNGAGENVDVNKTLPIPPVSLIKTPPYAGPPPPDSPDSLYSDTLEISPRTAGAMTEAQRTYTAFSPQFAPKNLTEARPHIASQYKPFSPGYTLYQNDNIETAPKPAMGPSIYPSEIAPLKIEKPFTPPPRSTTAPTETLAERRARGSRGSDFSIPAPIITDRLSGLERTLSTPTVHVGQAVKQVRVSRQISDVQKDKLRNQVSENSLNEQPVSPLDTRNSSLPDILKVRSPQYAPNSARIW